ncbi:MAG: T9SS type A sorting domain-containing protein, partial [Bacteroidota bacterium]
VDGFGTLRLPGHEAACLRLVARDIAPGTNDLKFQYLTQEGFMFEVRCWTDQPDTGIVTAWATRLILKESLVGVSEGELQPGDFVLYPNYPNPFNPTTRLAFSLSKQARAVVRVFDLFGREVRTLFDGEATTGRTHQVVFDGAGLSSGVYIVRLESEGRRAVQKITLMK